MGLSKATTDFLYEEVLCNTHCLVVSLEETGLIAAIDRPWGEWTLESIQVGQPLPEPLTAVLESVPTGVAITHLPFIYLNDEVILDVFVMGNGAARKLILRDVTEAHRAELKLQQKAYEVSLLAEKQAELNRQIEVQRAELARANQAKSRFIASMSHEFRTPITSIMGYADLLAREPSANGSPAAIQRASWHLLTLVENLLEQARQGEGAVHLNPGPIDIPALLRDLGELFYHQALSKGLELVMATAPKGAVIVNDELRLRQALINLLSNAVRYTREGRVELGVRTVGDRLEFAVSDTGPGIKSEDRERIFMPFERLDAVEQTGAGLGLSITRQVVEAMGGELKLDSEPGKGSTFRFSLSLAAEQSNASAMLFDGLRVLLVEDDPDVSAILELYLTDFGFQVDSAASLAEGLALIGQAEYDVVVTDLFLDQDSGADLLRAVREAQPTCRTLLCSGTGTDAGWEEHFGTLADEFLLKPVQPENLRAALERIMVHHS
jgi:signal transduction histidine kinase